MKEHFIVQELLTLASAGLLDPAEQRRVETHVRDCAECSAELEEWSRLAGALRELPTPQAPARLVLRTQRLLKYAAAVEKQQVSRLGLALLVFLSWMCALITVGMAWMFDFPISRWLDISSTTVWVTYIGVTWLATALAAGLLGKRWRQEGKTI